MPTSFHTNSAQDPAVWKSHNAMPAQGVRSLWGHCPRLVGGTNLKGLTWGDVPSQGSPLPLPTPDGGGVTFLVGIWKVAPPQPFIFSPQTVLAHTGGKEARLLWVNAEGFFLSVGSNQVGILSASAGGLGWGCGKSFLAGWEPLLCTLLRGRLPTTSCKGSGVPLRQPLSLASLPDDGTGSLPLGQPPVEQLPGLCHAGRLSQVRGRGNSQH